MLFAALPRASLVLIIARESLPTGACRARPQGRISGRPLRRPSLHHRQVFVLLLQCYVILLPAMNLQVHVLTSA